MIDIWGHTDPQPIKSSGHKDNFDLGFKRAHAVYDYFTKTVFSNSKKRFRLHSAGEHEPFNGAFPPPKEEYSKCRRVELKLGENL